MKTNKMSRNRKRLYSYSVQALEQAAQGAGWVPIPGGV